MLLKRVFARESQFWPARTQQYEFGLGHLTAPGADTLLLWNPGYYLQLCSDVLPLHRCDRGYATLTPTEQTLLQSTALQVASAACEDCPGGVDMQRLDASVEIIAHTLAGNAGQVGQIIRLITGKKPGDVASYEDLWRFSLVNYNAGPGCLTEAIKAAWAGRTILSWAIVADKLPPHCRAAATYVEALVVDGSLALHGADLAATSGDP